MFSAKRRSEAYESMTVLLAALPPDGNYSLHTDESRSSRVKLFAPHGGCIEPGTDQIVVELADREYDYFLFRGRRKADCYKTLHVTSVRYDEPNCLRMADASLLALSIHGCDSREEFIEIGGTNHGAVAELRLHLDRGGYRTTLPPAGRQGSEAGNFINRSKLGGVQLELSAGFRASLFPGFPRTDQRHPAAFREFIAAMRSWLAATEASLGSQPTPRP